MANDSTDSNQTKGPFDSVGAIIASLTSEERTILGIPFFLLITIIWQVDRIPENTQRLSLGLAFIVFILAWIIVSIARWRRNVNRTHSLVYERDLLVENWNNRYQQMQKLKIQAQKVQRDLFSLSQEGRIDAKSEILRDVDRMLEEIEQCMETTNRRVLELEQAESVVQTPDENRRIAEMLRNSSSVEAAQSSNTNSSTLL